jgi:dienelactone hydrolase
VIAAAVMLVAAPAPAGELADALRELQGRLDDGEVKTIQGQLGQYLKTARQQVNRRDIQAWESIRSRADWEHFRDQRIAALKKSLGTFPPPGDVKVHVTKTTPGDGFVIENLVYESRPGLWVTANLYCPAKPQAAPGILIIHSHHNPKTQGELQDMGMTWARAGCYVLVPDQLGHGERRQHPYADAKSYPGSFKAGRQDYYFRYNLALQLHLVGESLIGWMANDMMRGVDLLLAKPGIDKNRIALLGSVAGGGDPAGVTAALDPRIGVVAPFNFGGPQPETNYPLPEDAERSFNYLGGGSWESTRGLRLSGRDGFLPWVIVGSVASRGLMHAHEFAWDRERDPVWKRYQRVFSFYDAGDKLTFAHGRGLLSGQPPEATHCNNIGAEHRKGIHAALAKWWKLPVPQEYSKRLPSAELQCLTPELKAKIDFTPVHRLAGKLAESRCTAAREQIARFPKDDQREHLTKRWHELLGTAPLGDPEFLPRGDAKIEPDVGVRHGVLKLKDFTVPFLALVPRRAKSTPVVIAVAQGGRAGFLKHRSAHLEQLLKSGIAVFIPDLPGCGATAYPGDSRGRTSASTSLSATAQMHGKTILGVQLQCLEELIRLNAAGYRNLHEPPRIAVWGDSFAPVNPPEPAPQAPWDAAKLPRQAEPGGPLLALLAGSLSDTPIRAVYQRGGLINYRSVLESPFIYLPHDTVVPGALTAGDLDLLASVYVQRRGAPRLRIEAPVTGVNQLADAGTIKTFALRLSQAAAERTHVAPTASAPEDLAAWFRAALQRE